MIKKLEDVSKDVNWELYQDSPVPLYYQLSRFLEMLIQDEALQPGDQFPTEEAIAKHFHVSRPTANKAVQSLLAEGFLSRDKGLGTFVKEKPFVEFTFLQNSLSFGEQFTSEVPIRSKMIWHRKVPATKKVAKALGLDEGAPTILLRRLRFVYNRPLMVCDSQLSAEEFPDIARVKFIKDSLYKTLEDKYNCPIISSERYAYAAEVIEPEIVKLLEVQPFTCTLMVTGISYTRGNKPVDYLKTFLPQAVLQSPVQ